jgi:hypothetical protein
VFVVFLLLAEKCWGWTMPNLWYFPVIIFVFILIASFMVWKDEHEKTINLEQDLERLTKPQLATEFDILAVAPAGEHNKDSVIIIMATIVNAGAPSIISDVKIIIKRGDMEIRGENIILGDGPLFLEGEGLKITTKREDNLIRKGSENPIPTGGALNGWHIVLARDIKQEEMDNKETTVVFSYKDVTGRFYSTERKMDKAKSKLIDGTKLQNRS